MRQEIKSIGIDIGTSTTQLVFSRIVVENVAGSYNVPRVSIVDKEVIYRSKIYFTPLRSATEIDAEAVKKIVKDEYESAGMTPADLSTGAVIITGETARKQNANEVLEALKEPLQGIVQAIKLALEQTPPELGADVAERGIVLTGGGALLANLDRVLRKSTGLPVSIAEDPLTCVAMGTGRALEEIKKLHNILSTMY